MGKKEIEEIKDDLKSFRQALYKLQNLEDELKLIAVELGGDTVKSPRIKSSEEAQYQEGTHVYKNAIPELMENEKKLIPERDYYLYRVKKVEKFLQSLDDKQVKLIECRYWYKFSIRNIAKIFYTSKSTVCRELDAIFEFWDMSHGK